ncbi:hypothetical protein [Acinetobacter sp. ANC 4641]|uniref:hypothetical protein n=1 Tax=Acinetobacter sp. ANC 4641 TaxID=2529847 RepID=UPI0010409A0D|nr:hypothetical protein [Acinetobacter sp. ANC 4641]TCB13467.1 hypothetical protein E0H78_02360 [Acinetobacter sp. ANC 4641]
MLENLNYYIKTIIYSACILGCSWQLVACSPHSPSDGLTQSHQATGASLPSQHHVDGQKLLDVAGKSTMPVQTSPPEVRYSLNNQEKTMVGRYIVTISCQDPIAHCDVGQQGSVEYIINLMEDGSVFRLIKSFGKVYADTRTTQNYQHAHWKVITEDQKKYVVVHFNQHLRLYYLIDHKGNIMMDSQRNFEINRYFFEHGHPYTLNNYYLVRASN